MKMVYWSSTGIISVFLLLSTYSYLFSKSTIEGIRTLGFPDFFRLQLAVLKFFAAVVLILPLDYTPIKEWAYAGVALFLITALVAHIHHKDSIFIMLLLIILMGVLIVSRIFMHKLYI